MPHALGSRHTWRDCRRIAFHCDNTQVPLAAVPAVGCHKQHPQAIRCCHGVSGCHRLSLLGICPGAQ
jgi:hypothetical protein